MRRCLFACLLSLAATACSDPPSSHFDAGGGGGPDAAGDDVDAAPVFDASPPDAFVADADPSLPNLVPMGDRITPSIYVDEMNFSASGCSVAEGCAIAGFRRMLRFDTVTTNAGGSDLFVGEPGVMGGMGQWEWSNCHGHYHFLGYASYELVDLNGDVVMALDGPAVSRKQAFCLEDTDRIAPDAKSDQSPYCNTGDPPNSQCIYHCGYQGISKGWADTYGSNLTCQWIDICGVPEGDYYLKITINPLHLLNESNYADNVLMSPVHIDAQPGTPGLCAPQ